MAYLRSVIDRSRAYDRRRKLDRNHKKQRTMLIRGDMRAAEDGYAFICGDSHVELVGRHLHSTDLVNAGIIGATSSSCAELLDRLEPARAARLAILIVGTNDILYRRPLSLRRVERFRANVDRIVHRLRIVSERILVSALPPICDTRTSKRECLPVEVYTNELKCLCIERDCGFFDPFDFSRGERFGLAAPGTFVDGVHLADYALLAAELRAWIGPASRPCADEHPDERANEACTVGAGLPGVVPEGLP